MSRISATLALLVALIVLCAIPALAFVNQNQQPKLVQQIVPTGYVGGSLSYHNGVWTANSTSGEVIQLLSGTWQGRGFSASSPVWTNAGIACYHDGFASIWNGTELKHITEAAQFSSPYMDPESSANGDVAFARMSTHFLLIAHPDGTTDGYLPFNSLGWPGSWWVTSTAFTPGGTMYVSGQNTNVATDGGYRVVGRYAGMFFDTGMAYSEIEYGGGMLWGITSDHRALEAWSLYSNGSIKQKYTVAQGDYYNFFGGDQTGVMYQAGSQIWKASTVPEPASMLGMMSGLVGLVGFGIRRRKK